MGDAAGSCGGGDWGRHGGRKVEVGGMKAKRARERAGREGKG